MRLVLCATVLLGLTLPAFAEDAKYLESQDLAVQTHKWDDKLVKTTLQCFYADVGDFRCMGQGVRVDFNSFDDVGQKHLENDCDTVEAFMTYKCRVMVQFTYKDFHEMETDGSTGELTVVEAEGDTGVIIAPPQRQRRTH